MSRIGRKPIEIPATVKVAVSNGVVTVSSADGKKKLEQETHDVSVKVEGNQVVVEKAGDTRSARSCHGLYRTLIANMIEGVTKGWEKRLEVEGAGYKVELKGRTLVLTVGYTHPREYSVPQGIDVELAGTNALILRGASKELVGQTAASIRGIRPADPYRGKGIRYTGEQAIRKVAKGKG